MRIGFDVAQTCVEKAGCGWYADSLIREMARMAPEHSYTLYHQFDRWINEDTSGGTVLPAGVSENPFRGMAPGPATAAWDRVRAGQPLCGRPDIVHANSYQAPKIRGAKLVFTVYDVSFWMVPEYATEANRLSCQEGMLRALRTADGFVFISQSSKDEFDRILPNWLEINRKPWAVTPLGPKSRTVTVTRPKARDYWLAVGSLEPRKNYGTLLDAMEIYWGQSPRKLPLRIAGGPGWKSGQLKARIETLGRRGMVNYLGYAPEEAMPGLYAGAEALVFPSWYEGFGLPVIEAMNVGCPVISSGSTSLGEVGRDAALSIDPARADTIAGAMLRLEDDEQLQASLSRASLVQASKFSWSTTAALTLEFYGRVLAASPDRPAAAMGPAPGG